MPESRPNGEAEAILECMGRKRIPIEIPNYPFTMRDLAEKHPHVSTNVFHVRLQEWISEGKVRIIGKRQKPTGKGWHLYEKAVPQGPSFLGEGESIIPTTILKFRHDPSHISSGITQEASAN